jgi:hypothetical protein
MSNERAGDPGLRSELDGLVTSRERPSTVCVKILIAADELPLG